MSEKIDNYSKNFNQEKFQKTLTQTLEDFKIDPKEARELLKKFDLEKEEIIQISQEQLKILREQFGDELNINNLVEFIKKESQLYLETKLPDKELLYDGLSNYVDFNESKKSNEVSEVDTFGSNLYVKYDGNNVIITGQNNGVLFVEKVLKQDYLNFVENYDKAENKRILEQLGFTGGLTLGGVLSFSFRTGIGLLLGALGTGMGVYRGFQMYKGYNLSSNEALEVFKNYKNEPEIVKNYLYLSQIGYITGYNGGTFETIDSEKLSKNELAGKESSINIEKYQLLRGLSESGYKPKFIGEGRYELDMVGLFDNSPLTFDGKNIKFSTSNFENRKEFVFSDVKTAFEKIGKINEYLDLETQFKNSNDSNIMEFNSQNSHLLLEKKLEKLKNDILKK